MIRIFRDVAEWRAFRRGLSCRLGFVPTMGALHGGHLELVKTSLRETERTLVSIFVNPTQFDDAGDYRAYPRALEQDLDALEEAGAHFVLAPERGDELYADGYRYRVQESDLSKTLCGAHRPGHFDGVLSVVLKLLNLSGAERAYFGEKDYQQLELIRGMVDAFFVPVEIVGCPTVREADGLAMSSRNRRLGAAARRLAAEFPRVLKEAPDAETAARELRGLGFGVDYVEERFGRRLGAVRIGEVRLIDNVV